MSDITPTPDEAVETLSTVLSEFSELVLEYHGAVVAYLRTTTQPEDAAIVDGFTDGLRRQVSGLHDLAVEAFGFLDESEQRAVGRLLNDAGALNLIRSGRELLGRGVRGAGALAAIIQFIEPIKKILRLIFDYFFGGTNGTTQPWWVRALKFILDFIDNLLGNDAQALGPEAEASVARSRNRMYEQLQQINRTEAARFGAAAGRVAPAEEPDPP